MIFFITIYSFFALDHTHLTNFLKIASENGQYKYAFVKPTKCFSGKSKNSYAFTLNNLVTLKQLSRDGSIGLICIK